MRGAISTITYLIYILIWDGGLIFGTAYLVFWLDRSPLWFIPAVWLSFCCFKPGAWARLWHGKEPTDG